MGALAERLQGLTLTLYARAGEGGKLYGSVSSLTIAAQLSRLVAQEVDRRLILLPEPIKALGTYTVPVRLLPEVVPTVTVVVEGEEKKEAGDEAPSTEKGAEDVRREGPAP